MKLLSLCLILISLVFICHCDFGLDISGNGPSDCKSCHENLEKDLPGTYRSSGNEDIRTFIISQKSSSNCFTLSSLETPEHFPPYEFAIPISANAHFLNDYYYACVYSCSEDYPECTAPLSKSHVRYGVAELYLDISFEVDGEYIRVLAYKTR